MTLLLSRSLRGLVLAQLALNHFDLPSCTFSPPPFLAHDSFESSQVGPQHKKSSLKDWFFPLEVCQRPLAILILDTPRLLSQHLSNSRPLMSSTLTLFSELQCFTISCRTRPSTDFQYNDQHHDNNPLIDANLPASARLHLPRRRNHSFI